MKKTFSFIALLFILIPLFCTPGTATPEVFTFDITDYDAKTIGGGVVIYRAGRHARKRHAKHGFGYGQRKKRQGRISRSRGCFDNIGCRNCRMRFDIHCRKAQKNKKAIKNRYSIFGG